MSRLKKIIIIDYEMSNMFSISNALKYLNFNCEISSDHKKIISSDGVILPGVGSFHEAMKKLKKLDLIETIKNFVSSGKPFVGICLGFQLLFSQSSEYQNTQGLKIFNGEVQNFIANKSIKKIPHVGWNSVKINTSLFDLNNYAKKFIDSDENYYFVHSYYVLPKRKDIILSTTNYQGLEFCSSVLYNNVFACQFHPEKSGYQGLKLLKNFFNSVN